MPRRPLIRLLGACAVGALLLLLPRSGFGQGRPDCAQVLRKMHPTTGAKTREPDAVKIAKALGVEADYVERCAEAYGRRVKSREDSKKAKEQEVEGDSQLVDQREGDEYDELSREEKETLGDKYYTTIENDDEDRKKLRASKYESTHEWDVYETHEWEPNTGHEWEPVLLDDDPPFEE
jgi:hypothetical protein